MDIIAGDANSTLLYNPRHTTYRSLVQDLQTLAAKPAQDRYLVTGGLTELGMHKRRTYKQLQQLIHSTVDICITHDPLLAELIGIGNTKTEIVLVRTDSELLYEIRRRLEPGDFLLLTGVDEHIVSALQEN